MRKIIRSKAVQQKTGFSGEHIRRLERAGVFPQHFKLNSTADPKGNGAVGWFEDEVDEYFERCAARRDVDGAAERAAREYEQRVLERDAERDPESSEGEPEAVEA